MERHEEKIRATIKRNKKIITFTTLVGLICPATLGTIQALADETASQTEQTEQQVTEPVTPEQPTATTSQEHATLEPVETVATESEQTAPIEQITEVAPTESVQAQSPVTPEPIVTPQADLTAELAEWNNYFAQIIPLLDELESKVTGTSYQARYDELQNRFDFVSFTGGQFPESTRDQVFYDQWLPELASILSGLQQLKADISSEPTVSVTGVTLAPIPEMGEGGTYQLTATVMPENATNKNVTFSSSDTSVATVDANGLVTAIAKGSFTITVTTEDGNYTATASSTIKEDDGIPLKDFDYTAVLAAIARYDAMVKDKDSYTLESWEAMEAEMINNDEKLHFIDYLRKLPDAEGSVPPGYENQLQTDLNNYAAWAHTVMDMAIKKDVAQTGLFYDLVGDTSAKVGETKTYTYDEVKFFSDGSMTQTTVNIADTSYPLTSSNPSDVIVGGSITFGSEGTRTLVAKDNAGASLTVTVTKEDVTPPVPVDIELNVIGETSAKVGESKIYQLEKTEYFSDGTKKITILDFPNEYGALISSDPSDIISNGTITFTKAGTRTLKSESYGEATFIVTVTESSVTPPKDVDKSGLEEAIKKGEQAIKDGNWKDDSKLVTAIEDGKKILNDDKATQAQVNEAVKNIIEAINALEKADNNGNGNGGNNGNDNNQNSNNGNGSNPNNGTGNNNQNKANNSNNQSNKNNTSNKDNLPQTGDTTTNGLLAGLSMIGLSAIAWIKRKRRV